jgi:hypothetical protein
MFHLQAIIALDLYVWLTFFPEEFGLAVAFQARKREGIHCNLDLGTEIIDDPNCHVM